MQKKSPKDRAEELVVIPMVQKAPAVTPSTNLTSQFWNREGELSAPHAYNAECESCIQELATAKYWRGDTVRALGIVDGWVVVRKRGAAPFLLKWGEWYALPETKR